jgi:seryl-tRNA synthetase
VEQEATVLRSKTQTLEQENDKYLAEIKKLQLQAARQKTVTTNAEIKKLKDSLDVAEKERDELEAKLNRILDESGKGLPSRMPKVVTDMHTKLQLKVSTSHMTKIWVFIVRNSFRIQYYFHIFSSVEKLLIICL